MEYEVADTKLARTAKAATLIQLCVYGELLERVQGVAPERMHAILGDGRMESFPCSDFVAYYRRVKERFLAFDSDAETYPTPVEHCARCRWSDACVARRRADDHLSLVANVRGSQIAKLTASGVTTVATLAELADAARPATLNADTFARIRAQARLQIKARNEGKPDWEFLKFDEKRGFALLPKPDEGDLYFDMEGDPFYGEHGLEYLFGVSYREDGRAEPAFLPFWGHDPGGERKAFEGFIDFVMERRARFPTMHVYHYAPYEATALKRMASRHATREEEVDVLLRERLLVDLFAVVRQALLASFEGYGLKKIEQFYLGARSEDVKDALGSVVAYERYRETGERRLLDEIAAYNRIDCESTLKLHAWLLDRRGEAIAKFGEIAWRARGEAEAAEAKAPDPSEALSLELTGGAGALADTEPERSRWLAGQLLLYHRREAKPEWWALYDRLEQTPEELVNDSSAIGGLVRVDGIEAESVNRSLVYTLEFPAQEHKVRAGSAVYDPAMYGPEVKKLRGAGSVVDIDEDRGRLRLHRGPSLREIDLPLAIVPNRPLSDTKQREALARFGLRYALDGASTKYRALGALLRRDIPRVRGREAGALLDDGSGSEKSLTELALALDESYLFVQGPPGSGKTWRGASVIVDLLADGRRVGVSSTSHKAIHNLLHRVEEVAAQRGVAVRGMKKSTADNEESVYRSRRGLIASNHDAAGCQDGELNLLAGTAWLFADVRFDQSLDVLVIDEAGQVSLADALASGTAARNLIFLGDPMQLAQVSQASHPEGSDASVLEHLLGDRATVEPQRGVFLSVTYRMQKNICRFISDLAYDGRLHGDESCELQRLDPAGAGLRYLPIAHAGNTQQSLEEAEAIAAAVARLLEGTVTDCEGSTRRLEPADVMVVTPYNAQVRRLRRTLDAQGLGNVRAGTVDKFQGQEAMVVFFSMASSRGDELPRGLEFLFDRNRLNVAVSRARALAVLVCAPALLDTPCTSVEQLRMVNALCRFVEDATGL